MVEEATVIIAACDPLSYNLSLYQLVGFCPISLFFGFPNSKPKRAVSPVAAASLLLAHKPPVGKRHDKHLQSLEAKQTSLSQLILKSRTEKDYP